MPTKIGSVTLGVEDGHLIAWGSNWGANTRLQYQVYSAPQMSVAGGETTTDASGHLRTDAGLVSNLMNVYPDEKKLTFTLYPIIGQKAHMDTILASATYNP